MVDCFSKLLFFLNIFIKVLVLLKFFWKFNIKVVGLIVLVVIELKLKVCLLVRYLFKLGFSVKGINVLEVFIGNCWWYLLKVL